MNNRHKKIRYSALNGGFFNTDITDIILYNKKI